MKLSGFPAMYLLTVILFFLIQRGCMERSEVPRILYVNSYHEGYPSSDSIMAGLNRVLETENLVMEIHFLDSKRHPGMEQVKANAHDIYLKCNNFSPDLIIVSDDNAVARFVVPYLNGSKIPVVFCGVNWSAESYRLKENVAGMLEVMPLKACIESSLLRIPEARKIGILSENTLSERNNTALLDTLYRNLGLQPVYRLVEDFERWKTVFRNLSDSCDLIYMPTNGAIRGWDTEEAMEYARKYTRIPAITCDDFMMDYCVLGFTKVASEQGEWAASTALAILRGRSPAEFPYTKNRRYRVLHNPELGKLIEGWDPPL